MQGVEFVAAIWFPFIWWQLHRIANALDRIKPERVAPDEGDENQDKE